MHHHPTPRHDSNAALRIEPSRVVDHPRGPPCDAVRGRDLPPNTNAAVGVPVQGADDQLRDADLAPQRDQRQQRERVPGDPEARRLEAALPHPGRARGRAPVVGRAEPGRPPRGPHRRGVPDR